MLKNLGKHIRFEWDESINGFLIYCDVPDCAHMISNGGKRCIIGGMGFTINTSVADSLRAVKIEGVAKWCSDLTGEENVQ